MELKDTIELMQSDDWKDRFKAEYFQTKIRYVKLHKRVVQVEAGTATSEKSIELIKYQKRHMGNYLFALEVRAEQEGIDLGE